MISNNLNTVFEYLSTFSDIPEINYSLLLTLGLSFTYNSFWILFLVGNMYLLNEKDHNTCPNLIVTNYIIAVIAIFIFIKTFLLFKFQSFFGFNSEIDCFMRNAKINQLFSFISFIGLSVLVIEDYGSNIHCWLIQYYDIFYLITEALILISLFFINKNNLINIFRYKKIKNK